MSASGDQERDEWGKQLLKSGSTVYHTAQVLSKQDTQSGWLELNNDNKYLLQPRGRPTRWRAGLPQVGEARNGPS